MSFFYLENKKQLIKNGLCALVPVVVIIFLYRITNQSTDGSSGIGYSNVANAMKSRIMSLMFSYDFYQAFFHQLSYMIAASFFIGIFGLIYLFFDFNKMDSFKKTFLIFVTISLIGFLTFIAIFVNTVDISYHDTNQPLIAFGRYFVALVPVVFILGLFGLERVKEIGIKSKAVGLIIVLFLILGVFTPLHSANASGVAGGPDVTYLCGLFRFDFPPWNVADIENNLGGVPWTVAGGFVCIFIAILFFNSKLPVFVLFSILLMSAYTGTKNQDYAASMASFQKDQNDVYKYLVARKISPSQIALYENYDPAIYISQFWFGFFDFAKWTKEARIYKKDLGSKIDSFSNVEFVLANKTDLKDYKSLVEFEYSKIVLVSEIYR